MKIDGLHFGLYLYMPAMHLKSKLHCCIYVRKKFHQRDTVHMSGSFSQSFDVSEVKMHLNYGQW